MGQVGTGIAGLVGVKVLTNVLGPSEFGRLALANSVVMLISTNFLFGPLGQGLMRFWSICRDRGELGAFYVVSNRCARYVIGVSIAVAITVVVILASIKWVDWALLLTISMATGIVSGTLGLRISVFTAARQRKRVALLSISNALFSPIVAASLVLLVGADALSAMFGYLIVVSGVAFVAGRLYCRAVSKTTGSISIDEKRISSIGKNILLFSWPYAVWAVFGWAHASCDRWSIQTFHGPEVVGAYVVVSQLATFPLAFGSGFLSSLFSPIAFQKAGDINSPENLASANKFLCLSTGAYIFGAFLLIALYSVAHHRLVLLISNIQFAQFSFLLPWLTLAWGLFYLGQVLFNFKMLVNQPQSYIVPKVVSTMVAVMSTFYLSARIGPSGVVLGLGIGALVYALWCVVIVWDSIRFAFTKT